ncbi:MAG: hypothetical protein IJD54_04375 [Clostridia bacterium]|nr:hypothetical protein [Clostridia bacterium]
MKIKSLSRILLILVLTVFLFSVVGVAAAWQYLLPVEKSESLSLSAERTATVHITKVVVGDKNSTETVEIDGFVETFLNSNVTLLNNRNSFVTVNVTVYNSSNETYAYNAMKHSTNEYSNTDIVCSLPSLKHGDQITAGEYLQFDATFKYDTGIKVTNRVLQSIINFQFLPLDELPEEEQIAVNGALVQFDNIINDINQQGTLDTLINQMDNHQNNDRYDDSYIGNVGGASDQDVELLDELFQGNLSINIDGVDTEVTIIIKRQNVDNNLSTGDANGREMAIYMTTDDLQKDSWFGTSTAPVFVSVFSSDDSGESWYQVGEMYQGTATIKQYNGYPGSGSFDTDTWKATDNRTIGAIIASLEN